MTRYDRNRDGKLTLAELERFHALIEQGVTCPLLLRLTECGRNLFCHLDTNSDERLSATELLAAAAQAKDLGGDSGWTVASQIPHFARIYVQHGFAGSAFGPLPLALSRKSAVSAIAKRSTQGPAWFHAIDRNGDGFLSQREFLGPLELFRRLDRNGDGLISLEEANGTNRDTMREE